jgi:hypothetical protein
VTIFETLRSIASELNLIYTTPPIRWEDGGFDCGWFCREHALHTKLLCATLNIDSDILLGDFEVHAAGLNSVTSGSEGVGHAWCRVKSTVPVDLSMTFFHFAGDGLGPQLDKPVIGSGRNGDFVVRYERQNKTPIGGAITTAPAAVIFRESSTVRCTSQELLADPFQFLLPPRAGGQSWSELFGDEIYAKVTAHCVEVAKGRVRPLRRSHDRRDTLDSSELRGCSKWAEAGDHLVVKCRESVAATPTPIIATSARRLHPSRLRTRSSFHTP